MIPLFLVRNALVLCQTPRGRYVGHSGGQSGTTCMLAIDPRRGVVAAVMTNLQSASGVVALTTRIVGMSNP